MVGKVRSEVLIRRVWLSFGVTSVEKEGQLTLEQLGLNCCGPSYMQLFFNKYMQDYGICGWLNPRMWNRGYGVQTVWTVCWGRHFQLRGQSEPLTTELFKGQLYSHRERRKRVFKAWLTQALPRSPVFGIMQTSGSTHSSPPCAHTPLTEPGSTKLATRTSCPFLSPVVWCVCSGNVLHAPKEATQLCSLGQTNGCLIDNRPFVFTFYLDYCTKQVTGVQRTLPKLPVAENILRPTGAGSPEEIPRVI